jgi:hypothetical protein
MQSSGSTLKSITKAWASSSSFITGAIGAIGAKTVFQRYRATSDPAAAMQIHIHKARSAWQSLVRRERISPSSLYYQTASAAWSTLDAILTAAQLNQHSDSSFAAAVPYGQFTGQYGKTPDIQQAAAMFKTAIASLGGPQSSRIQRELMEEIDAILARANESDLVSATSGSPSGSSGTTVPVHHS